MERHKEFKYHKFTTHESIPSSDRELLLRALEVASNSFSPYSNFKVGAAARLKSGVVICGTNIESEVFPAGICAERSLLFSMAANHPDDPIEALAITSMPCDRECSPCGLCRQSLLDCERRQKSPIRVIMGGDRSATIVESAEILLPFSFIL
ncbi:MAG: cytidine deaminase [Rikenellaceae bacterium]